ncbi:hypothetical protein MARLIPOL_07489 [Marinobacter lipolyticus SM19]|uniref:Uncharacterized protein n=1 Tax=Marinobacter lipolyticus SM19 TaxID=1318628 RepID=R8B1X3_9GAMM|nr:hypothetical protein [Marinobacter lipolyticus]EON92577.1 hypothetical protein MARLIPOL_07489 [Marinobacter lipolyticus SM19]
MHTSMIFKIIVGVAIILGGIFVVMRDDPAVPTGDINTIEPLPEQSSQ